VKLKKRLEGTSVIMKSIESREDGRRNSVRARE